MLELELADETLSFSQALGSVPNRGFGSQGDAFLNGVPCLQSISDVTGGTSIGIHFEPELWVIAPVSITQFLEGQPGALIPFRRVGRRRS